ncbi:MAG TPA: hypothetical protein VLB44_22760 [Kofleriaceae bacterium]|nr:hypothetical protein [Kofleriaceae bacterium]
MRRAVLVLCAGFSVGGCDVVFRIDHVGDTDANASVNGDADVPPCDTLYVDEFDGDMACRPWGSPDIMNASLVEAGGTLTVTPAMIAGSRAGCFSDADFPLGADGVIVEVSQVIGGDLGEFTLLGFGPPVDIAISAGNSELRFQDSFGVQDFGRVIFVQKEMRWWRMRPDGAGKLAAEYSADGHTWKPFGIPQPLSASVTTVGVGLLAGYNSTQSTGTGKSVFERLIVCR